MLLISGKKHLKMDKGGVERGGEDCCLLQHKKSVTGGGQSLVKISCLWDPALFYQNYSGG